MLWGDNTWRGVYLKFKAHLECDTSDFIIDVPFENLKREDVKYNIRMKLYELASIKAVYNPCDDDRQYTNSSTCEDDTY